MRAEWEPDELIGSWALIEAVQASGDLGTGEAVGQPQHDLSAVLPGESASRHRDLLRGR
jgi:hypothetical protein